MKTVFLKTRCLIRYDLLLSRFVVQYVPENRIYILKNATMLVQAICVEVVTCRRLHGHRNLSTMYR